MMQSHKICADLWLIKIYTHQTDNFQYIKENL